MSPSPNQTGQNLANPEKSAPEKTPVPADLTQTPQSQRIVSLDALRGFDMFWIIGGSDFAAAILQLCSENVRRVLGPQLRHAPWEGFRFFDLIYPLFIFLVGITTVLSLTKILDQRGKGPAYFRLIRRAVLLYLLGFVFHGGFSKCWPDVRLTGVLQRIAVCYLVTGILCIHFRLRGIVIVLVTLLVGYWAWLSFVPVPGLGATSFEPGKNWSNYLDARFLPGYKHDGQWDPQGYLSTLPAIGTCLLGVLAAYLLRNQRLSATLKVLILFGAGVLALAAGFAWGMQFPIIKKIWTSSYVLVAGGYSLILLGVFYTVIDVWKLRRWAAPFVWIGTNAITLYMAIDLINFRAIAERLVGGDIQVALGPSAGGLLLSGVSLAMVFALAGFLHRQKIFLRI